MRCAGSTRAAELGLNAWLRGAVSDELRRLDRLPRTAHEKARKAHTVKQEVLETL